MVCPVRHRCGETGRGLGPGAQACTVTAGGPSACPCSGRQPGGARDQSAAFPTHRAGLAWCPVPRSPGAAHSQRVAEQVQLGGEQGMEVPGCGLPSTAAAVPPPPMAAPPEGALGGWDLGPILSQGRQPTGREGQCCVLWLHWVPPV